VSSKFTVTPSEPLRIDHSPQSVYHFLNWIVDDTLFIKKLTHFCNEEKRGVFLKDIQAIEKDLMKLNDLVSHTYQQNNLGDPENSMDLFAFILNLLEECSKKQGIFIFFLLC